MIEFDLKLSNKDYLGTHSGIRANFKMIFNPGKRTLCVGYHKKGSWTESCEIKLKETRYIKEILKNHLEILGS